MRANTLALLGIAATIMVALAFSAYRSKQAALQAARNTGYFLPEFSVDGVARIRVRKAAAEVLLQRTPEKSFVIASSHDYPASLDRVNDLFTRCGKIEVADKITSNPANHAKLGVTEPSVDNPDAVRVDFEDETGKTLAAFYLGKSGEARGTPYVRRVGSDDVFEAKEAIDILAQPMDYVDREIVKLPASDIASILHRYKSDDPALPNTVTLDRGGENGGGKLTLLNIPEGREVKPDELRQFEGAFGSVSMDDFKRFDDPELKDLQYERYLRVELKAKTVYTFDLARQGELCYLKGAAEWIGGSVSISKTDTDEKLKEKEALLLAQEAAETFQRVHGPWIYVIPEWKHKQLTKTMNELTQPAENK